MLFNPNQTESADDFQRRVWQYGINIVPPEVSLASVEDEETREGCMQIYNYTMEILENAWNQPNDYLKEETLPVLYTVTGFRWLFGFNKTVSQRCKDSFALFQQKLPSLGFNYDERKNAWINDRYPLFCEYMKCFLALYKKKKQNMGGYPERCDFRLFAKRMKFSFDDLLRSLPDKERIWFLELREYAVKQGAKEHKDDFRYYYEGLQLLNLQNNPIRVSVSFDLKIPGSFERFLEIAENQPDADLLIEFIRKNLNICDGCAANTASRAREKEKKKCGYYSVDIRGTKLLSCLSNSVSTYHYSKPQTILKDEDINMLKRMMDIRITQIGAN